MKKFLEKYIRLGLLLLFAITIPNSIAISNIALGLLVLYWIFLGDKKETFYILKTNPIAFLSVLFYFTYVISLLWSQELEWGLYILKKEVIFLFVPILMSLIKENERDLLIKSFIVSMTFSEIISYSIHFKLIPPMFHATPYDPSPFMSHVHYNPFLAFTIYLLVFYYLSTKESKIIKYISLIFIITMSINLFITGGRAGQIAFFVMLIVIFIQFFNKNIKNILVLIVLLGLIFGIAYNSSTIFKNRVNQTIYNLKNFNKNSNTSIGKRIVYWKNTIELIQKHPIGGVGVGDFKNEYRKIHFKNSPSIIIHGDHPHNMYLFVWGCSGLLGLFALLAILIVGFIISVRSKSKYSKAQMALIVLFSVIMFSDCYLLGHYSKFFFVFFVAVLFKDAKWEDLKKS